ncbi:azurin [Flavobacteriaceae bacterium GSB9]|nr:azurin [Flavobacteriaceae bacterium GSB9]
MKTFQIFALLLCSVLMFGCGNKAKNKNEGFTYEKTSEPSKVVPQNPNNIVITANDAMQFNKKEIRIEAGKEVKVTLRHIGKMDKNVMGHNFVLLKQGVDVMTFGNKAAAYKNNEFIPENTQDVIAHTKLIGGGEVAVVEFDAPEKGTYEFLCSFPGHYALMRGKFIVE